MLWLKFYLQITKNTLSIKLNIISTNKQNDKKKSNKKRERESPCVATELDCFPLQKKKNILQELYKSSRRT